MRAIALVLAVTVLVSGCAVFRPPEATPAVPAPAAVRTPGAMPQQLAPISRPAAPTAPAPEYRLGVGDLLEISLFRQDVREADDLRRELVVRPDGKISYFFIGDLHVAGLTVAAVRAELTNRLGRYVRSPEVAVILVETAKKRVFVTGEVVEQGVRELRSSQGDSVLDAIFASKGLTKKADADRAYVVRQDEIIEIPLGDLLFRGDRTRNIVLRSEDVIYVPEATEQRVFVVGYVKRAGAFEISRPIRVTEAIALAEDFQTGAKRDAVQIVRGGLSRPADVVTVDVERIRKGEAPDVYVQRGDIVLVSNTLLAKWNELLGQLIPSLQTLFIGTVVGTQLGK